MAWSDLSSKTRLTIVIVVAVVIGAIVLGSLLIAAQVKCGCAWLLFSNCLPQKNTYTHVDTCAPGEAADTSIIVTVPMTTCPSPGTRGDDGFCHFDNVNDAIEGCDSEPACIGFVTSRPSASTCAAIESIVLTSEAPTCVGPVPDALWSRTDFYTKTTST